MARKKDQPVAETPPVEQTPPDATQDETPASTEGLNPLLSEEGVYKALTLGQELRLTGKGGTSLEIPVRLVAVEGSDGKFRPLPKPKPRTIRMYFTTLKSGEIAVAELISAFGFKDDQIPSFDVFNPDNADQPGFLDLSNKVILVNVSHEEYNGKTMDRVRINKRRAASTPDERQQAAAGANDILAAIMQARREKSQQ